MVYYLSKSHLAVNTRLIFDETAATTYETAITATNQFHAAGRPARLH